MMKILITNPYKIERGGEYFPGITVCIKLAWERSEITNIPHLERWNPKARNQMHKLGAVEFKPNIAAIGRAVEALREKYPDAEIQDNPGVLDPF
jgi:hypothetical protein